MPGRWRRATAWLCLATVLAFAGVEALHHHNDLARQGSESQPCRICQVSASTLTAAAPRPLVRPVLRGVGVTVVRNAGAPALLPLPQHKTRPPPTVSC